MHLTLWPLAAISVGMLIVPASARASETSVSLKNGTMKIQFCSASVIHVRFAPGTTIPEAPHLPVENEACHNSPVSVQNLDGNVEISSPSISVEITRDSGTMSFKDSKGMVFATDDARSMTPVEVAGRKSYRAERFSGLWGSDESFYGLGSQQSGIWDLRGESVDLSQDNAHVAVPLVISSRGYGILWNNASRSRFNNQFPQALYLSSESAQVLDYYLLFGPDFDQIVASYRNLTGQAPLFPKWAFGFWQSRNRYKTQNEILDVAEKFRKRHFPVDAIVQDWFWWKNLGDPIYDPARYPDPQEMLKRLHLAGFHYLLSTWPFVEPSSRTYAKMNASGHLLAKVPPSEIYPSGLAVIDAFSVEGRKEFWDALRPLLQLGVDGWWLDADEPETENSETNVLWSTKTEMGPGADHLNLYPTLASSAIHDGQRSETDQKRVVILSRSAYSGAQKNGVIVWSGDVRSDWRTFQRQIPAGLNFSLAGMPYWTSDIGGFTGGDPGDPAFRELFTRWFEFGAFCPIFRVHGSGPENEPWAFGPKTEAILATYARLRYRLLPYLYSISWQVTHSGYTMMRPLVMDFRADSRARATGDEFLLGSALLVSPVTEAHAERRDVYLPSDRWYDFWNGKPTVGGRSVPALAPIGRIPLFVRAGSILPLAPEAEFSEQKSAAPTELRIYPGKNADFSIYEDEGDGYGYEKGAYSTISLHWDDALETLFIGERQGGFPGQHVSREFQITRVREGRGAGSTVEKRPDRKIVYQGKKIEIRLSSTR